MWIYSHWQYKAEYLGLTEIDAGGADLTFSRQLLKLLLLKELGQEGAGWGVCLLLASS